MKIIILSKIQCKHISQIDINTVYNYVVKSNKSQNFIPSKNYGCCFGMIHVVLDPGLTQELQAGGPIPPQLTSEVQMQTLLGPGRHMSPLLHHLDLSLRGDTPQFPQLGFEWRTNQLVKMQALLRPPLKLPLPLHQGWNWSVPLPHPIRQRRKSGMY